MGLAINNKLNVFIQYVFEPNWFVQPEKFYCNFSIKANKHEWIKIIMKINYILMPLNSLAIFFFIKVLIKAIIENVLNFITSIELHGELNSK